MKTNAAKTVLTLSSVFSFAVFISAARADLPALTELSAPTQALTAVPAESAELEPSSPLVVAMVFSKLARVPPDLDTWAKLTAAYQNAQEFDRPEVLGDVKRQLVTNLQLLTLSDPIVMEMKVQLSSYDSVHKGFFVRNFRPSTFFPVHFAGKAYAVVPKGIFDRQWIPMDNMEAVKATSAALSADGGTLLLRAMVTPLSASATTVPIEGEDFMPLGADIRQLALYTADGKTQLWHSTDAATADQTHSSILKLYQ